MTRDATDANAHRPLLFRLGERDESRAFDDWKRAHEGRVELRDTLAEQLRGLVRCKHPKRTFTTDELEAEVRRHRAGRAPAEMGVWVYYPWRRTAVRLLDEEDFVTLRTSRSRHKITQAEQEELRRKIVGIVGLSVGSSIAVTIAIERSCGELRLADFDRLELSNLNRLREGVLDLGLKKTVLAARAIAEIDPFLNVVRYDEGLTRDNLERFLTEQGRLDVLIEECDGLEMKLASRLRARELGIPVVMEANDRGTLDIERFDLEPGRPILHGLLEGVDLSHVSELRTNEEKVPILLPMVGEHTMSVKLKASLLEVGESLETWPQLASDVALGAGLVANAVRRILLGDLRRSGRYFVDLDELVSDGTPAESATVPKAPAEAAPHSAPHFDPRGEPGQLALDRTTLAALVEAATLAPSGGNEQPWRWVTHGPNLSLLLHEPFGDVLLNPRNLARWIALGAAAENLVLEAHALGVRVKPVFGSETNGAGATFRFFPNVESAELEPRHADDEALAAQIERRTTNRRTVAAGPLDADAEALLRAAVARFPGCRLHVVTDAARLAELAEIVARTERIRLLHPAGHRDFVREVRWTRNEAERTRDGVDLTTLELTASERAGLGMLREPKVAELLRRWKLGRGLEKLGRRAIAASSAVGLVTAPGSSARDRFIAGRAVERAWLTATRLELAVQPHTAPLGLFARAFGGDESAFDAATLDELAELKTRFDGIFGAEPHAVFLFRVFPGREPPARSLRRPASYRIAPRT